MRVPRRVLDAIAAHARAEAPQECCGLLIGCDDDITEAVATRNVADEPLRRYKISPEDHFALIRQCRTGARTGAAIVGGYHSHPRSEPAPSPTDTDQAFPGFIYLIAGPADGSARLEIRAYMLLDGRLDSITLSVVD